MNDHSLQKLPTPSQIPLTIVEVKGGLGNQLFQFAAGLRRVQGQLKALYFNVSYYDHDSRHGGFVINRLFPSFQFQLTKAKKFNFSTAYLNFDNLPDFYPPEVFEIACPIYLSGYFQNFRLVNPVLPFMRDLLKVELSRVRQSYSEGNTDFHLFADDQFAPFSLTSRKHIIGIHLRRGDYLQAATASLHGIPTIESVLAALNREIELAGGKHKTEVILFTDSKELSYPFEGRMFKPSRAEDKVSGDIEEFIAMSLCDALICSNSSFSYWAGLLSSRMQRHYLPSIWMKSGAVSTESLVSHHHGVVFQTSLD